MDSTAAASITPCTFTYRRLYKGNGVFERGMFELKDCYINSDTFIIASSPSIPNTASVYQLVGIVMDAIELVQIVQPSVQNSETATYSTTSDGKPQMTVTINNNEISPTFQVPFYDLNIPQTYTEDFSHETNDCTEIINYISVGSEENPDNSEQTFGTFSFDLSGIFEFQKLSCIAT